MKYLPAALLFNPYSTVLKTLKKNKRHARSLPFDPGSGKRF